MLTGYKKVNWIQKGWPETKMLANSKILTQYQNIEYLAKSLANTKMLY